MSNFPGGSPVQRCQREEMSREISTGEEVYLVEASRTPHGRGTIGSQMDSQTVRLASQSVRFQLPFCLSLDVCQRSFLKQSSFLKRIS